MVFVIIISYRLQK